MLVQGTLRKVNAVQPDLLSQSFVEGVREVQREGRSLPERVRESFPGEETSDLSLKAE